jgi:hypothetical protein
MTLISASSAASPVPYRYRVEAVAAIAAVNADFKADPKDAAANGEKAHSARQGKADRVRYSADSAAPAFAAQILVEAGLTGQDPFSGQRAHRAYASAAVKHQTLRLTA